MDTNVNPAESLAIIGIVDMFKRVGMSSKFAILAAAVLGILWVGAKNNFSIVSMISGLFTGLLAVAGHTTAKAVGGNKIQ